ncbi:hypothetical protein NUSPORA_00163 [Nucleospora cyclopteri]
MNIEESINLLQKALLPDLETRTNAEIEINKLIQNNFGYFIDTFLKISLDPSVNPQVSHLALIVLKNAFNSKHKQMQSIYDKKWIFSPEEVKSNFIRNLKQNLNHENVQKLDAISNILGSIIRIQVTSDDHLGQTDFFSEMAEHISNEEYAVGVIHSTFHATGQLFDETEFDFSTEVQSIYKVCTFYLSSKKENLATASLLGLYQCMDIFDLILDQQRAETLINMIFNCFNTHSKVVAEKSLTVLNYFVEIQTKFALLVLNTILEFYLNKCSNNSFGRLQMCQLLTLLVENDILEFPVERFLPIILDTLAYEIPDDTSITPHKIACDLLVLLSDAYKQAVLRNDHVSNFIVEKFNSGKQEEIAVGAVALGASCSENNTEFLTQALPVLLDGISNDILSNNALYALGRISEKDFQVVFPHLEQLLLTASYAVSNDSDSSSNAIWLFYHIFHAMNTRNISANQANVLKNYSQILEILVLKMNQIRLDDSITRNSLVMALCEITKYPVDENLTKTFLNFVFLEINKVLESAKSYQNEIFMYEDKIIGFIVLLTSLMQSIEGVLTEQDKKGFLTVIVNCLKTPKSLIHGEAYISVSKIVNSLNNEQLSIFVPYITDDLQNNVEQFVIEASAYCLSDIAKKMETDFGEFLGETINALVYVIGRKEPTLIHSKNAVIDAIGDISLATGACFIPYISMVVMIFQHVNTLSVENDRFATKLTDCSLQMLISLVVGVGDNGEMRSYLNQIMTELRVISEKNASITTNYLCIILIRDIYQIFRLKELKMQWIFSYIRNCINSKQITAQEKKDLLDIYTLLTQ